MPKSEGMYGTCLDLMCINWLLMSSQNPLPSWGSRADAEKSSAEEDCWFCPNELQQSDESGTQAGHTAAQPVGEKHLQPR